MKSSIFFCNFVRSFFQKIYFWENLEEKKFFSTHLQMQERIVELATQAVVGSFRAVYKTARKNGKKCNGLLSAPSALHSFNVFLLVMILHKVIFSLACVLHFVSFRVVRSIAMYYFFLSHSTNFMNKGTTSSLFLSIMSSSWNQNK